MNLFEQLLHLKFKINDVAVVLVGDWAWAIVWMSRVMNFSSLGLLFLEKDSSQPSNIDFRFLLIDLGLVKISLLKVPIVWLWRKSLLKTLLGNCCVSNIMPLHLLAGNRANNNVINVSGIQIYLI